ncbi:MAG TPA: non-homologous end-joining DNA ligase [Streptosporangiaceae bacterium]
MSPEAAKVPVTVEGRTLVLSNLAKVLYPETGFTKAAVIDYYQRIAPVLLPHIADRPLTLKRYPDGVTREFFYQKEAPAQRPDWVPTVRVPGSGRHKDTIRHVTIGDLPTLIWAANLADLEIHTPMWRHPHVGRPDLLVFDLDPGPPAGIADCCTVALLLRTLLAGLGLNPLAKTSGGKGMQLLAAISGLTSGQASDLARSLAENLERNNPGRVTSRMAKPLRRGKVFIDWSQNNAAKTTVAPYSLRAMRTPTVSTPVTWDEVSEGRADLGFTSEQALERVAASGDLLAPLLAPGPRVTWRPVPRLLRRLTGAGRGTEENEHHAGTQRQRTARRRGRAGAAPADLPCALRHAGRAVRRDHVPAPGSAGPAGRVALLGGRCGRADRAHGAGRLGWPHRAGARHRHRRLRAGGGAGARVRDPQA